MAQPPPPDTESLGRARARITGSVPAFLARYPHVDAAQLLRQSGIDATSLGNRDAFHSVRSILTLLELAAKETGDDCFGLELGAQLPMRDLDVLGYVMMNSPTLGIGLESMCRYYAVQQNRAKFSLERGPAEARLLCTIPVPESLQPGQYYGVVFGSIVKYAREATGNPSWAPRELHLAYEAPRDPTRFERYFGAPVRFRQPANTLILPVDDLALPLHAADPALLPILRHHADELLAKTPVTGDYRQVVRRELTELLRVGDVAIEDTAARLKTTPRSLQRRLRDQGSSFQEILTETRLALAQQYLGDPALDLTEIAFLLGYSELSAFSRAFRRWTDQTPLEFRRRVT